MTNKIDEKLIKIMALNDNIECLLYVRSIELAKQNLLNSKIHIIKEYPFINAILIKIKPNFLTYLSQQSYVKYISSQAKAFAQINVAKDILKVNNYATGKGVAIAYIDTGIENHLDFVSYKKRISAFVDFINKKSKPYDDNGHGTFVSGLGSGNGFSSCGKFVGIAPQSQIVSIKALDKNGEAMAEKILDAMQFVYDNHKELNIKVVCMSFGSEPLGHNDPIMRGAESLWQKGIVIVAAAGNSGPEFETIKSPGISPKIITVGGFDDKRHGESFNSKEFEVAEFSSRGPAFKKFKPDIIAPSVEITSCGKDGDYIKLSGTSVATPMIAGICALIYELCPYLTADIIKNLIISSCKKISNNKNLEGNGYPDFLGILNNLNYII